MLTLSTRGRYATRILCFLAAQPEGEPISKQAIAESEDITPDYIEQILTPLREAGLVQSHRGRHGGFTLAVPPEELTVAQILEATDGPLVPVPCLGSEACTREAGCPTRRVWAEAVDAMRTVFQRTSIADLDVPDAGQVQQAPAEKVKSDEGVE